MNTNLIEIILQATPSNTVLVAMASYQARTGLAELIRNKNKIPPPVPIFLEIDG